LPQIDTRPPHDVEVRLSRTARVALRNMLAHSRGRKVDVMLTGDERTTRLTSPTTVAASVPTSRSPHPPTATSGCRVREGAR